MATQQPIEPIERIVCIFSGDRAARTPGLSR